MYGRQHAVFPAYAGLILSPHTETIQANKVFPAYAGLIPYTTTQNEAFPTVFPAYAGLILLKLLRSSSVRHCIPRLCGVDSAIDEALSRFVRLYSPPMRG